MKMNKKTKEGIKRKIASFSLVALLLNVAMVGVFVSRGEVRAAESPHITTAKVAVSDNCGTAEITLTITGAGDPIEQRKPVDVVFVIDRSVSMEGYFGDVQSAVTGFIDEMNFEGDPDKVAIVSYAQSSNVDYLLGTNKNAATDAVNELILGHGTCIECGLIAANGMLGSSSREQFVILLSDGVANIKFPGETISDICYYALGESSCPIIATDCINNAIIQGNNIKNLDVPIYSIGYRLDDLDCDNSGQTRNLVVQTLRYISSGADYYFSGGSGSINQIFQDIVWDINNVAGYDTKIVEVLPPGINYTEMISGQSPNSVSGQTITWEFGNLAIDESREVVFSVATDLYGDNVLIDEYPGSQPVDYTRVEYYNYLNEPQVKDFSETRINIDSCFPPETGSITIIKDSQPDDEQLFMFSGGLGSFNLFDNGSGVGNSIVFSDVSAGNYTITEAITSGWTLDDIVCTGDDNPIIDKLSRTATVNLDDGENVVCTFINSEDGDDPCDGIISGCKYKDVKNIGTIDTGEEKLSGWKIQLIRCTYTPLLPGSPIEFLPKSNINTNPEPGATGYCSVETTITTGEDGCYSFTGLSAGDYGVNEVIDEITQKNWTQTYPIEDKFYYFNLVAGNEKIDIDFLNYHEEPTPVYQCSDGIDNDGDGLIDYPEDPGCDSAEDDDEYNPYCGDGVCNNNETCSTCSQDCGSCGGGGGGWTPPTVIKITDEKVSYLGNGKALVSWKTNVTTTNQVVYGDDSLEENNLGDAPEYDYDSVNKESSSMWKEHEVMITGLIDGITYYFRPVADRNGSAEVIGEEVSYVFEEEGEVKGVTDPPAPVECNYLLEYIKLGADNNPVEVEKLERFLNEFEGENLPVNGIYEQIDFDAVSRFQEKYLESVLSPWSHNKATGYVYITTKKKINEIYCQRTFPLTAEQEAEVASFSERFLGMLTGSAEASDSSSEDSTSGDTSESFEAEDEEDVSGRVGGAKDEVDESDGEDETIEETENGTEDKDETKKEDEKPEDKTDEGADITEDAKGENESEVAGIEYSEYLLWFAALVIIAGIAWYYWPKRKEGSE